MLKKVCHITRRFVKDRWGGTESSVLRLSQELERQGVDSPIYSTCMFSRVGDDEIEQVKVKRYPYVFPWFFLSPAAKRRMALKGGSPLSFSMLWDLLREKDISLIHTHVHNRLGGIARSIARWKKIPYVVSVHAGYHTLPSHQALQMMQPFKEKWEWGKFFGFLLGSRRTLRDADAIICVGQDEYEIMQQRFPNNRVHYVPNGVDIAQFRDADPNLFRLRYGYGKNDRIILCMSRIDPQKNQSLLVKAFSEICHDNDDYRLVLVGPVTDEAYGRQIQDLADQLGIWGKVQIIPGIAPDNPLLASAFKAAELFVLPSTHEPFGIVILEAWAAGVPVIASDVGGIPGFTKDKENILLFPSEDGAILLKRMRQVLRNPKKAEGLRKKGLEAVKAYDWGEVSKEVVSVYKSLLDHKKSGVGA